MPKRYYKFAETHRIVKGHKQKYCTTCKQWKAESDFRRDRAKRDGLRIRCRDCDDAYEQEYRRKHRGDVRKYLRFEQRHRIAKGIRQKLCSHCKQWKDESDFHRNASTRDGLECHCKECQARRARERRERRNKGARKNIRYEDRHRIVDGVREKLCTKCRTWKKESEYYRDRSNKDGLSVRCRDCLYAAAP